MNLHEQISRIKNVIQMIDEASYLTSSMKLGMESEEIEVLQDLMKIPVTGDFNEETEDCVKEFQTFTDIKVDGIVGPETREKLNELLDGKLKDWLGCKKTKLTQKLSIPFLTGDNEKQGPSQVSGNDVVGSSWKSCKAWRSSGGLSKWGDKIKIERSSSGFLITYEGPSSGLSIAHAKGGGDTIHQAYNVLICEINPFLAQGGLKPELEGIRIEGGGSSKNSKITIFVPFTKTEGVWQLDRRGGWNHNPGPSKMSSKCRDVEKSGKECIGPVSKIVTAPFGKITEYFVTHQV